MVKISKSGKPLNIAENVLHQYSTNLNIFKRSVNAQKYLRCFSGMLNSKYTYLVKSYLQSVPTT